MNSYLIEMMARENQQRINEEMKLQHMRKMAGSRKPRVKSRIITGIGQFLINVGTRMKQRNNQAAHRATPDPHAS